MNNSLKFALLALIWTAALTAAGIFITVVGAIARHLYNTL